MREPAEIDEELLIDRLVEVVGGRDILGDFRRQAAFLVEGTARRQPHHEKRQRDDDE
jgi:hypothetical protein